MYLLNRKSKAMDYRYICISYFILVAFRICGPELVRLQHLTRSRQQSPESKPRPHVLFMQAGGLF